MCDGVVTWGEQWWGAISYHIGSHDGSLLSP